MTSLSGVELLEQQRLEWLCERAEAETEPCDVCGMAEGVTCVNLHTGEPLRGLPAHGRRIAKASRAPRGSGPAAWPCPARSA